MAKKRRAYKKNKKKSNKSLIKPLAIIVIVFALIIGIKSLLTADKAVVIIHNKQNIARVTYPFVDKRIGIIEADTSLYSQDEIMYMMEMADGVVFAGGNDFDPSFYGGDISLVEDYSREDDEVSLALFDYAVKNNKPILGICRGMQLMNIYYGGSLYDDIGIQYSNQVVHRGDNKTLAYHPVTINEDSRLYSIVKTEMISTNSFHHEGIKDLASGLSVSARSDDGLIEAIENPYYPYMIGFQWHPELSYEEDEYSREIFDNFIRNMK